jgi:hypothetical protein
MTPAIGGASAGMNGIGSALAKQPAPGGAAPAGPPSPGGGPGQDAQAGQLQQLIQLVRQIGELSGAAMQMSPLIADEMGQIQQLLKQAVIKAAGPGPMANASGMAVPGNGGGA